MKSSDKIRLMSRYPVIAGNMNEFTFEIEIGEEIQEGQGFLLAVPVGWTYPQKDNPLENGYVKVEADAGIEYELIAPLSSWQLRLIRFIVKKGSLKKGAFIKLVYGDLSEGGAGAMVGHAAHKNVPFPYTRELDNSLDFTMMECSPLVDILPNQAAKMTVRTRTNQMAGEPFELYAAYEDDYGNKVRDFEGELHILNGGCDVQTKALSREDKGSAKVKLMQEGSHHLAVYSKELGRMYYSNPIEVSKKEPLYKLYFGEIHGHTDISDAVGTLDEFYRFGRDFTRLDFCAASNHDMGHNKNALSWNYHNMTEEKWRETVRKAKEYYCPGRFVTFSGLEFSFNMDGHMNIYFLEDDETLFDKFVDFLGVEGGKWPVKGRQTSSEEIYSFFQGCDYILIPHHPGINFSGYDTAFDPSKPTGSALWDNIKDEICPVVEVYSKHGNSVRANDLRPLRGQTLGCFMDDVLKTGRKFGFIGGSDTHYGNPGSRHGYGPYSTLQYPTGLAAVYAKELTREGIFEALRARRCYATTYARIILKFYVNGHFMGEEFALENEKPQLLVEAHGEGRIKRVDIFKNGKFLYSEAPVVMRQDMRLEYIDEAGVEEENNYYYVRVLEAEGDMAWSSPVFIRGCKHKYIG